jgi:signal transduction histidine kinase
VAVEPLVHDVAETAHLLGEAAGVEIAVTALEPATVLGDLVRLRQLFLNLVTNAIKYTPAGGRVELALRVADGVVAFTVRDTGIGIAAADLPYIFDRFWRADRARSRRPGGADASERGSFGLGLAISQWIAQAHGGHIAVASRLTRGTTFTVTLPAAADPPHAGDETDAAAAYAPPGRGGDAASAVVPVVVDAGGRPVADASVRAGADRAGTGDRAPGAAPDLIES